MFQPVLRPLSYEERCAQQATEEYEQAVAADAHLTALIDGTLSEPDPEIPAPSDPVDRAWEDYERTIPAARRAEAAMLLALLAAHRAAEDETIARWGVDTLEPSGAIDAAFRHEAAMTLDIGDNEVATLLRHLDLAERWLPKTWVAFRDARLNRRALQTIVRQMDGLDLDRYAAAYDQADTDAVDSVRGTGLKTQDAHRPGAPAGLDRGRTVAAGREAPRHRGRSPRRRERNLDRHGIRSRRARGGGRGRAAGDRRRREGRRDPHHRAAQGDDRVRLRAPRGPEPPDRLAEDRADRQPHHPRPDPGRPRHHPGDPRGLRADRHDHRTAPRRQRSVLRPGAHRPDHRLSPRDGPEDQADQPGHAPLAPIPRPDLPLPRLQPTGEQVRHRPSPRTRPSRRFASRRNRPRGPNREWFADAGPTNEENLAHLCRRHHGWKSKGIFRIQREPDGTLTWTFPSGRTWTSPPADPEAPAPTWLLDALRQDPDQD